MRSLSDIAAIMLLALLAPMVAAADGPKDQPYGGIVGFGDSLSDPGNKFFVTGEQSLAPFLPVPGAPYAIGDNHYSDGETWLEQLAKLLKDPLGGKPGYKINERFANYSYGGARARNVGGEADLSAQVLMYLGENGAADPNSLHAIWIGSNDARDAIGPLSVMDFAGAFAIIQEAVNTVAFNIGLLHANGANDFLVLNLPNLAITPAAQANGLPGIQAAFWVSDTFNAVLDGTLAGIEAAYPDIVIHRVDIWDLLNSVYFAPESFGLENATTPCLSFGVIEGAVCDSPETTLFWDWIHPTTATHAILAGFAYGTLTGT